MSIQRQWFRVTVLAVSVAALLPCVALCDQGSPATNAKSASMMVSEHEPEVIARAEGPVSLGPGPVLVKLVFGKGRPGAGAFSASVGELATGQRIYLVFRNPHAAAPPGVVYHFYLDLPPGIHPAGGDPRYVGALNFYAFTNPAGREKGRFHSFDVTPIAIDLKLRDLLTADTTVTIVPAGSPLANATIDQIELIRQ
jgi:hypothetical protein